MYIVETQHSNTTLRVLHPSLSLFPFLSLSIYLSIFLTFFVSLPLTDPSPKFRSFPVFLFVSQVKDTFSKEEG